MTGESVIAVQGVRYTYPGRIEPALSDVGLQLSRGQTLGLLGPNGSGKSTLINLLVGLRMPQRGTITRLGGSPSIAWVPQEYAFYPELTCQENLEFFVRMLDIVGPERAARVQAAIETCMLQEFVARRARECSGGVRRRLNLGIGLLQRPDVLLLDEPTVGVDPQSRAFLLERVREIAMAGTAVLYASHYMEEVSAVCTHILVLDHGSVLASGDLQALLRGDGQGGPFPDLEALFMKYTQRRLRDE
jgi:ABC-2 type transport system ATP-binding protein